MRVNVQLIEAETGAHIWAERFDKPIADLFDMQDEIVARIANALKTEIVSAEARRAERTPNPDAIDLLFRGFDWINRGVRREYLANARDCFRRALEIDPDLVGGMVGLALADTVAALTDAFEDGPERIAEAEERALALAPRGSMAHYCFGLVLLRTGRAERAIDELKEALSLDPNLAFAHAHIGFAKIALGHAEEAEAHIVEAMRLSPRDPGACVWCEFLGVACLMLGRVQEALRWLRKSVDLNRSYPVVQFHYAAALALLGRIEEARVETRTGLASASEFTIRRCRQGVFSDNTTYLAQHERIFQGMRLAGVPEQ